MDPDYPFPLETIQQVEAVGFELVRRFGNFSTLPIKFLHKQQGF
jgi:hypothetical protein